MSFAAGFRVDLILCSALFEACNQDRQVLLGFFEGRKSHTAGDPTPFMALPETPLEHVNEYRIIELGLDVNGHECVHVQGRIVTTLDDGIHRPTAWEKLLKDE